MIPRITHKNPVAIRNKRFLKRLFLILDAVRSYKPIILSILKRKPAINVNPTIIKKIPVMNIVIIFKHPLRETNYLHTTG